MNRLLANEEAILLLHCTGISGGRLLEASIFSQTIFRISSIESPNVLRYAISYIFHILF